MRALLPAALVTALILASGADAQAALPGGVTADVDGDGRDDGWYVERYGAGRPWPGDVDAGWAVVGISRGRPGGVAQPLGRGDPGRLRITAAGRIYEAAIVGDMDRDGHADVAIVRRPRPRAARELLVIRGRAGGGTLRATPRSSLVHLRLRGPELGLVVAGAGDVDGDGRGDLLVQRGPRTLLALRWRGPGASATPLTHLRLTVAARPLAMLDVGVGAGDVDGDGAGDIAVALYDDASCGEAGCSRRTAIVRGGASARTVRIDGSPRRGYAMRASDGGVAGFVVDDGTGDVVAAGDADGDGLGDVVTTAADLGTPVVVYGKRDGHAVRFGAEDPPSWAGLPNVSALLDAFGETVGAGDTDGDGFADVAVAARDRLRVAAGRPERTSEPATARAGWQVFAPRRYVFDRIAPAGDVNGDGLADLRVDVRRALREWRSFLVLGDRSRTDVRLEAVGTRGYELTGP